MFRFLSGINPLRIALILALVAVASASAQDRKPDGRDRNERERDARRELEERRKAEESELRRQFAETYAGINSPRMLVWVSASPIEGVSLPFGWENDRASLLSSIESRFMKAGVEIIDADSLGEADRRQLGLVGQRVFQDFDFVRGLGQQADIFLHAQLRPSADLNRYRLTLETAVVSSGRRIGSLSADWVGGTDAETVDRCGQIIMMDWMRAFVESFKGAGESEVSYKVILVGLDEPSKVRQARDALMTIPGVRKAIDRGFSQQGDVGTAEFMVQFSGRPLDFVTDLQQVSRRELQFETRVLDVQAGSITLVAQDPSKKGVKKRTPETYFAQSEDGEQARKELAGAYQKQGSPRIAVIVNRELAPDEAKPSDVGKPASANPSAGNSAVGSSSTSAPILVQFFGGISPTAPTEAPKPEAGAGRNDAQGDEALNARSIEAEFFKVCKEYFAFRMVDAAVVRSQILREAKISSEILKEEEAAALIRLAKDADVVILGSGRFQGTGSASVRREEAPWVHYTFRAIRVSDGAVLAAENKSMQLGSGDKNIEEKVRQLITKAITGSLVHQMLQSWIPPSIISVTVTNAKSSDKVYSIMDTFEQSLGVIGRPIFLNHNAGSEGGLGMFEVRYNGTFEDLIQAIDANKAALPFDLQTQGSNRDGGLKIRVKDGV